ncbi:MAG: CBS domain-containing protein [Arenicellales bacterium]
MKLENILIQTGVASPGMLVREAFTECVRAQVPAIPFRDDKGELTGRVSLRHTMKKTCLPDFMVEMAYVLGDDLSCVRNAEEKAVEVLGYTIDEFVMPKFYSLTTDISVIKVLAIMEKHNSSYLFIVDDGVYKGVVTTLAIAQRMVALDSACSSST